MNGVTDYRVLCLSEAASPLTHMKGVSGNEALIAREPVVTPRGIIHVPKLSGNALRHRLVREPGARYLTERWDLRGRLTLTQLNFLYHGGNLTEGGGREDVRLIATMQTLFPLLRLLGSCTPAQVIPGSLLTGFGVLVCEENRRTLQTILPSGWEMPEHALRPAETFVSGYQYVRGDVARMRPDLLANGEDLTDRKSSMMPFSGQWVVRGSIFLHTFTLQHCSSLELGALLHSLACWRRAGGTIGGQGARGHGRLDTLVHVEADSEAAVTAYLAHVETSREAGVRWLDEAFRARPMKPARGKKKEAASAEPA